MNPYIPVGVPAHSRRTGLALAAALAWLALAVLAQADDHKTYVGSEVCGECHEEQHASFTAHSRKSHSFESVAVLKKGLTEAEYRGCLACHATGYGEPGGFRSESETPHLKNAGCESCHGPGSLHADSGDPDDIRGELSVEDCTRCHNAERVGAFKFKPLLFGGAH